MRFQLFLQLFFFAHGYALPTKQQIFNDKHERPLVKANSILSVRYELKRAEIIPNVIDDFLPSLTLSVKWPSHKSADLGNNISPVKLQDSPSVTLENDPTSSSTENPTNMTYTIVLTDPDAPSRDNPKWSEFCHWIATDVPLNSRSAEGSDVDTPAHIITKELNEVVEYHPPGPPPKTGKHRYVFLVFAPANGTSQPLTLSKPKDRQNWGTGKARKGARQWAEENGLLPVGANFIYAQNDEQ